MIKSYLLNLRPYSWVDIIMLGFLAKFSVTGSLAFELADLFAVAGLLGLWFFFNLILEIKHDYDYRKKVSVIPAVFFLLAASILGFSVNPLSFVFVIVSTIFVLMYLKKADNKTFGMMSSPIRGIIQAAYFIYALFFFTPSLNKSAVILALLIFVLYTARAIVGDIRDVKQNKKSGKNTWAVAFDEDACRMFCAAVLLACAGLQIVYFGSYLISTPLILFALLLLFCPNGYVLHQLMVMTTLFFQINMISFFTSQSMLFVNLIYLGVYLNMIFYPLLQRKSNPVFVQENKIRFIV